MWKPFPICGLIGDSFHSIAKGFVLSSLLPAAKFITPFCCFAIKLYHASTVSPSSVTIAATSNRMQR